MGSSASKRQQRLIPIQNTPIALMGNIIGTQKPVYVRVNSYPHH